MDFQVKVLLLSFAITVIESIIIIPILKKLKVGQTERLDGPQSHIVKEGTPTMGGIIIMISVILTSASGFLYYYNKEDTEVAMRIFPLVLMALGFGTVGFIDDFKKVVLRNTQGLKPAYKMLGLLIVSALSVYYMIEILDIGTATYIPFFKTYIELPIWIYVPFAIFVILGTTNAINLTDGIDGLATSVTAIIMTFLTVISIIFDIKEVTVFGGVVVGTCLGFLLFNLHTAKVIMGDTGSLLLGGVVSCIALYFRMPLILLIIAIVPIMETVSVLLQVLYYRKTGRRIFKMTPIHHHFELCNWKENKIVSIFSIVTLVACIIALYAV